MAIFRREPPEPDPSPRLRSAEPSLGGLVKAVASSIGESIRQNKLSAFLALVALLVFIPLTGIRYDERPRYRQVILPEIERLEGDYQAALRRSEDGPTDNWQLFHFIDAHRRAGDVLDYLRMRKPVTSPGIEAHGDLILYYELVNEHFAILRTEMSLAMDLDFLARWEEVELDLKPIHDRWLNWVEG